jgi:hypothetical protein
MTCRIYPRKDACISPCVPATFQLRCSLVQSVKVNATATLTRSVPHIGRASELPKRTVSSSGPPAPLVSKPFCNGVR